LEIYEVQIPLCSTGLSASYMQQIDWGSKCCPLWFRVHSCC